MAEAATAEPDAARRQLGAALRGLLDVVVRADADDELLAEAAAMVETLRERLAVTGTRAGMPLELAAIRRDLSLVGGAAHPVGPQLEFTATEDGTQATTTLGPVFEGGPGLVHGGILALLLDHAMGHAVVTAGYAAMTTELALRFRHPTRLGGPVQVRARLDRKAGRKLYLSGQLSADGRVTVEASGVFVTLTGANVATIFGLNA